VSAQRRARAHELGLLALVAALTLFWMRPFFSGEALIYSGDTAQLQYPRYRILCDSLQQHRELPLWQTLLYGGSPFHANPENPTLYPPVLALAAFLPPVWTMNLTILGHLAVAGAGMFLLIARLWRRLFPDQPSGPGAAGACVGATIFALNFFTRLVHVDLVSYGGAIAPGPWLLLAADAVLFGERPRRAAGWLALLVALVVLSGGVSVMPYTLFALVLWFGFLGLLGDPEARRRTIRYGALAAVLAGGIVMAKWLPYHEWVGTTNRAGTLSYEEALSAPTAPSLAEGLKRVLWSTGGGWALVPVALALLLLRHEVIRLIFAGSLFFYLVSLGGSVHRFAYDWIPMFGQVRSYVRAWAGANLLLPIAAGLGIAWFLSRWERLGRHRFAPALLGAAVALALSPLLAYSYRVDSAVKHPQSFPELVARYEQWPLAAERAGADWRAIWFDKTVPQGRNEQFITSALGVETAAGYLGHAWPLALERHIYGLPEARLSPEIRKRRLGTLSVRYLVTTDPDRPESRNYASVFPTGSDGNAVLENPFAHPRAMLPSFVVGVCGDSDDEALYALLDDAGFPVRTACAITFDAAQPMTPEEAGALDVLVLVEGAAAEQVELARKAGVRIVSVHLPLQAEDRHALNQLAISAQSNSRAEGSLAFERAGTGSTRLSASPALESSRFAVISEPWSWYPGWRIEPIPSGPAILRRADGISTALLLPAGTRGCRADYAPRSAALGLWIGLLGLLATLFCIVRRERVAPS
jgi:hypothetical protein